MKESYGTKSLKFQNEFDTFYGPPFRTQLIWLSMSSLSLAVWGIANGFLNAFVLYARWVHKEDTATNGNASYRSWLDAEDLRDSWAQGREFVVIFWFVTIVVLTYSVAKVTAGWREKWNTKWAIGGWFIPFANLIIPFLVMQESERIIRHSLRDSKSQDLALSERFDTSRFWFFGYLVVVFVLGFSATLTPVGDNFDYNYGLDTYGIWGGILGSALLLVVVALAYTYFGRQNLFVNQAVVLTQSFSTQEWSGQKGSFKPGSPGFGATQDAASISEQIRHLGKLRDDGLITSVEFEQKKSELLGRI